jgi:hypothetical protein
LTLVLKGANINEPAFVQSIAKSLYSYQTQNSGQLVAVNTVQG